jgi:hypothetical protein
MGLAVTHGHRSKLLTLNGTLTIKLSVARCRSFGQSHGWLLRVHSQTNSHAILACLDDGNERFKDQFCDPSEPLADSLKRFSARGESRFLKNIDAGFFLLKGSARRSRSKRSAMMVASAAKRPSPPDVVAPPSPNVPSGKPRARITSLR